MSNLIKRVVRRQIAALVLGIELAGKPMHELVKLLDANLDANKAYELAIAAIRSGEKTLEVVVVELGGDGVKPIIATPTDAPAPQTKAKKRKSKAKSTSAPSTNGRAAGLADAIAKQAKAAMAENADDAGSIAA